MGRKNLLVAFILSIVAALLTLLPYIYAGSQVAPGFEFTGFLLNPWDGFTYLSKMQQGQAGQWGFLLPYALNPGAETYLYLYYIFLGHVAGWLETELIFVFHGARFIAAVLMFFLAYVLFERTLLDQRRTWFAFLLTLFGSGLGWLPLLFMGVETSDIAIPESIPYLLAYANAHFPMAAACILGAALVMLADGMRLWLRSAVIFLCGTLLVVVLPFSVVSLLAAIIAWFLWDWMATGRGRVMQFLKVKNRDRTILFFWLLMSIVPWIVYDTYIVLTHPIISAWTSQNVTPSPPVWHYLVGYGLLILLAIIGVVRGRPDSTSSGRLLLAWVLTGVVLLYVPIGVQRRLNLGLFFPIADLAAYGIGSITSNTRRFWSIAVALLVLTIPSNLIVVFAGLFAVAEEEPVVLHTTEEVQAFDWLERNAPGGSIILASPVIGNRIPALTGARVLFGHPFETPDADEMRDRVLLYFDWQDPVLDPLSELKMDDIDFVFWGPRERELGNPEWINELAVLARFGDVFILGVKP